VSSQLQLLNEPLCKNDVVYTPDHISDDMVRFFDLQGSILEPCKGNGAIYDKLSNLSNKSNLLWCEISQGKDFFAFNEKVDWIITNPPFSMIPEFLSHSFDVADNIVFLMPIHSFFRSGKLIALAKERGWVRHIRNYGSGRSMGFAMGNPIGAFYFQKRTVNIFSTTWSFYQKEGI